MPQEHSPEPDRDVDQLGLESNSLAGSSSVLAVSEEPEAASSKQSSPDVSRRLFELGFKRLSRTFGDMVHLRDEVDEEGTVSDIKRSIEFRGANLWALVFAILIASVGLNINSTAVIIGAMLISPLMGPIMGIGLALGTNDLELFKRSLRNLLVAVSISVLTSALYFLITPLDQAQSELLARTRPTIFDVLIAVFGGSIGIIASSRKEKTNAIPGVAIATALMPPLCTAGYGLANANWAYFFGAFYLFFINSVFICLSTFVFVRYLKFGKASFVDEIREKQVKFYLAIFAVVTVLPSVYVAVGVVNETVFQSRAQTFIKEAFDFPDSQIIKSEVKYSNQGSYINLVLIGEPLRTREKNLLISQLPRYQLHDTELIFQQPQKGSAELQEEFTAMNHNLRIGIVEDLYKKNAELLQKKEDELNTKNTQLKNLEQELFKLKSIAYPVEQVAAEIQIEFPEVDSLALEKIERVKANQHETTPVALIHWKKLPNKNVQDRLKKYLSVRLQEPKLELLFY